MKTIEEAINEISNQLLSGMNKDSYTKDEIGDMFDKILMQVHALPLASRLTAEEREKIRADYEKICDSIAKHSSTTGSLFFIGQMETMESIFGKEMFAEEGEQTTKYSSSN